MSEAHPSPPADRRAPRDPARTRQAILQMAFEEMHQSGFRGADVDKILHKSGVTKGALYHHFDGKLALGYAVVDEVIAEITRQKWVLPLRDCGDPIAALLGIVRRMSLESGHIKNGCPLNNLAQEMSPLDEGFRARTAKVFDAWHGAIAAALRRGQAAGQVRADIDPQASATLFIAAFEGYMSLAKCYQDAARLRGGQKALAQFLVSLRMPPGGRRRVTADAQPAARLRARRTRRR